MEKKDVISLWYSFGEKIVSIKIIKYTLPYDPINPCSTIFPVPLYKAGIKPMYLQPSAEHLLIISLYSSVSYLFAENTQLVKSLLMRSYS